MAPGRFVCRCDGWNRLTGVYEDDGTADGEWDDEDTKVAKYRYDGLNRRITKPVPNAANPSAWDRTDYYYNGQWQVLEERKETFATYDAAKGAVAATPYAQYIWDIRYIDAPICRFRDTDGDGHIDQDDETLYYTTDANFNVTALVDGDTDEVVERYLYDAYGRVTVLNGADDGDETDLAEWTIDADNVSDRDNELLYAGYRLDGETNLYHVRHRYHHPTLGRFISRDPDVYADGMNMYQYAQSGPITATDPMGLQTNQDLSSVMFWSRIRRMLQGACDAALMSPIGKAVAGQNPAAVARVATLEAGRYAQRSRAGEAITLETVLCDQHNQLLLGMPGSLRKAGETIYATGKSYTISRDAGLDAQTSLGNAVLTIAINHPVMIDAIAFKQRGEDDFTAVSRGVIRQTPILSLAPAIIEAASGKGTDPHDPATYDKDISPERQGGAIFAVTEYYGSLAVYVGVRGALSGAKGGELTRLRAKYGRVSWDELNARINARGAVAGKQWSVPAARRESERR